MVEGGRDEGAGLAKGALRHSYALQIPRWRRYGRRPSKVIFGILPDTQNGPFTKEDGKRIA